MKSTVNQQIVISGVGGQGVLFITRLIAEAAIDKGLPVMTSETHGMAQRGGTVVSQLKVGDFVSPLIRPRKADGLLALKAEIPEAHLMFPKTGAWAVVNSGVYRELGNGIDIFHADCDRLAQSLGSPRSTNLVLLGFAAAATAEDDHVTTPMFCSIDDIKKVLCHRFAENKKALDSAVASIELGYNSFESKKEH